LSPLVNLGSGIAGRIQIHGDGDRVLWIHGYTMDSSIWEDLWPLLPEWSHIGVDLPGHGASRELDRKENLSSLADQLLELALAQEVRHVIALSFGTVVAIQMAMQQPNAFSSIVLAAPALTSGPRERDVEAHYLKLALLYHQQGAGPHMRSLWMTSPPDVFRGLEANPPVWERLARIIDCHGWTELVDGGMFNLLKLPQHEDDLRRIEASVMILLGQYDMEAFKTCAALIARAVATCNVVTIPGAGHLALLQKPHDAAQHIRAHFLVQTEPRPA
jgi:pimeloyl-ACP methyl ester carboxylesterase